MNGSIWIKMGAIGIVLSLMGCHEMQPEAKAARATDKSFATLAKSVDKYPYEWRDMRTNYWVRVPGAEKFEQDVSVALYMGDQETPKFKGHINFFSGKGFLVTGAKVNSLRLKLLSRPNEPEIEANMDEADQGIVRFNVPVLEGRGGVQ